jgi:hypothetical protein
VFTRVVHWTLPQANWIQSTWSIPVTHLVIIYPPICALSLKMVSSLRVFWLKNHMNLSSPCLLHYPTYHALWFNHLNTGNMRTAQESLFLESYATNTVWAACLQHVHLQMRAKHLPRSSFQEEVHCSCAVLKQREISFYIKYRNIVYFKDTPVLLQGFMIVIIVWNVFQKLSLIFYLYFNCHKFCYSSEASDINWTWVREYNINTRGRIVEEKLKA